MAVAAELERGELVAEFAPKLPEAAAVDLALIAPFLASCSNNVRCKSSRSACHK